MEKNIENLLADPSIASDTKVNALSSDLNAKFEQLRPNKTTVKTIKENTQVQAADLEPPPPQQYKAEQEEVEPVATVAVPVPTPAPLPSVEAAVQEEVNIEKEFRLASQYHNKLSNLISVIKVFPKVIRAAESGELIINDTLIPHSSYIDAIRELYVHSGNNSSIGIGLLLSALNSLNIPSTLISNSLRKAEYIQLQHAHINPLNFNNSPLKQQRGNGGGPPGKRPRILLMFKK